MIQSASTGEGLYVTALIIGKEGPLVQVIHLPADLPGQVTRSRRQDLFHCSDLDAIAELERRSSAVSGVGGLAPQ
jgi:hypothetical protein